MYENPRSRHVVAHPMNRIQSSWRGHRPMASGVANGSLGWQAVAHVDSRFVVWCRRASLLAWHDVSQAFHPAPVRPRPRDTTTDDANLAGPGRLPAAGPSTQDLHLILSVRPGRRHLEFGDSKQAFGSRGGEPASPTSPFSKSSHAPPMIKARGFCRHWIALKARATIETRSRARCLPDQPSAGCT